MKGLVTVDTLTIDTAATQNCTGSPCAITQSNIDSYGSVLITTDASGYTVTLGDPSLGAAAQGRIIYVTNADATDDFEISANAGAEVINMKPNTTATMIWNGTDWTAAGASSSTDLQAAYDNTAASAGGETNIPKWDQVRNWLSATPESYACTPLSWRVLAPST